MTRASLIERGPFGLPALAASGSETIRARKSARRHVAVAALIAALCCSTGVALATRFAETDLVANKKPLTDGNGIVHTATFVDVNLVNPWGVGESSTSPFWVSDNGAGVSTLYNTDGTPRALVVSIPAPGDPLGSGGAPTGLVFNIANAQGAFTISGVDKTNAPISAPALFLFTTEDGTILGWNPNVNPPGFEPSKAGTYAIIAVDNSAKGAVYKGLAIAQDKVSGNVLLYATNFHAGTVEAYDTSFMPASLPGGAFVDSRLPRGYGPFNIVPVTVNRTDELFVTYAVQDADKHDDVAGQGHGIVDTFDLNGQMMARFAQHGQLNSPWGVALAPTSFGNLAGDLLIGNFGNGHINAFDPMTGQFRGKVRNAHGQAIAIQGLWTIRVGNGGSGGDPQLLYFTAGPNGESDGLLGSLSALPGRGDDDGGDD
jgi:uncharacterized protein (TIGR03118 family)